MISCWNKTCFIPIMEDKYFIKSLETFYYIEKIYFKNIKWRIKRLVHFICFIYPAQDVKFSLKSCYPFSRNCERKLKNDQFRIKWLLEFHSLWRVIYDLILMVYMAVAEVLFTITFALRQNFEPSLFKPLQIDHILIQ